MTASFYTNQQAVVLCILNVVIGKEASICHSTSQFIVEVPNIFLYLNVRNMNRSFECDHS